MRERLRLNWHLESNTPIGLTANWLLKQEIKDHGLEAMLAFWYPFALSQSSPDAPTVDAVPALSVKAEALLAISRLERQIALLRQTFLDESSLPVPQTRVPQAPDLVSSAVATVTAVPVLASPTGVTDAGLAVPSLLPSASHGCLDISGFESFDQSLSSDTLS